MNRLRTLSVSLSVLAITALAAGCGDDAPVRDPAILAVQTGVWTWIDVPGAVCDDGTPTGFAVNQGSSNNLYFYFEGGGACWDYVSCYILNTSVHGPYGETEWTAHAATLAGPFDRGRSSNPFAQDTMIYIPYCTSDLHAGSNVATYPAATPRVAHHVGRTDTEMFLHHVAVTWTQPERVVVSGTSAGGFGAALNYDLIRKAFPHASMKLIDDAGPLLEGNNVPQSERDAWWSSWGLGTLVDPLCAGCKEDLSAYYPAVVTLYPKDRMALLSSQQDMVIRTYFMQTPQQFQDALTSTLQHRFEPTDTLKSFLVTGEQHGLLGDAATLATGGVNLEAWLTQMVQDQPGWSSVAP
jgi:hypothetical protein